MDKINIPCKCEHTYSIAILQPSLQNQLTIHCSESHLSPFLHQLMLLGLGNTPFMHGNTMLPPSDMFTICNSSIGSSAIKMPV